MNDQRSKMMSKTLEKQRYGQAEGVEGEEKEMVREMGKVG